MNKTTKATLWILGVFAALSLGVYFAGCGDDEGVDGGGEGEGEVACAAQGDECTTEGGVKGKCLAVTGADPVCFGECTTVGDSNADGCCYYSADPVGNFVMPNGSKAVGDACGAASECECGAACLDAGSGMMCWLVCTDDSGCEDPATCTATDFGFSVCAE